MNTFEQQYLTLLAHLLKNGEDRGDRTGTGTKSVFGVFLEADIQKHGFPLLNTKKVHFASVAHELLWFIKAETNVQYLQDNKIRIWNEWADQNGELGRVYGCQWRKWIGYQPTEHPLIFDQQSRVNGLGKIDNGTATGRHFYIDQLQNTIHEIKQNPNSRRHLVTAWNPAEVDSMALPPCHYAFQFYVHTNGTLDLMFQMRSADVFLGLPFNIASYALLLVMVAHITGKEAGRVCVCIGDCHLYQNHINQAHEQLNRTILFDQAPQVVITPIKAVLPSDIDSFVFNNFEVIGYNPQPPIKAPISV
jgi:thymidylate synthase